MEIILISILSALVVVLGFTTFNLMKKNEQQEDILVEYMKYLHVSGKKDSKIRHIIDKFTNEQLDKLYNTSTSKLKELL